MPWPHPTQHFEGLMSKEYDDGSCVDIVFKFLIIPGVDK